MFYTVYKTTNLINNKFYIGCHKTKDLSDNYLGSGKRFCYALKKYGKDNFQKEILFIFNSYQEALNKEEELVSEVLGDLNCYNTNCGGKGGFEFQSKEEHLKVSKKGGQARKLKAHQDPEWSRRVMKPAITASNKSEKQKIAARYSAVVATKAWLGKKHSVESKQKMSKTKAGKATNQVWIHNLALKNSRRTTQDKLNELLDLGWQLGRKIKF